tara:strand:+ start:1668 stop:3167 length:1500 start_codon:yes stop_codon:yes gene_type:complete
MDSNAPFKQFSRQSKKGIIVIYLNLLYKVLKAFWVFLFIFIQKFSKISETKLLYIYLGLGMLLLFLLFRAFLVFKNFQYKIENNHFILKSGILKKTNTSIPFDRIQNINFKQNLIQQFINVFEVNIETAGSSKAEISIKALSFKEANTLKNSITVHENNTINLEVSSEQKPLLKINFLQLLKVSLTENHLQSLLLLFAILMGFFQQISELFKGFGKREVLEDYISENTTSLGNNILLIIVFFFVLILVSVISSIVRVYLRHFNLTVFVKNNALEIYQGLTTKKSILLKKEKVQHITVSHNPIKKKLGISFITFKQAISGKVKKKQDKIIKIVGCGHEQVSAIKNFLFLNENFDNNIKNHSHQYFKLRLYFRSFLFLLILNTALYISFETPLFFLVNVFLIPLSIALITVKFKKRYYFFTNEILIIGSGTIETHKTYLPFFKVQNVTLKQTFFQAKNKVIDLIFQTASGKIKIPCIQEKEAFKMYDYALFKVQTSTKSWM